MKFNPEKYAEKVLESPNYGEFTKLACSRFLNDIEKGAWKYDHDQAKRVYNMAGYCHHWKGPLARTPIELDGHQKFYLGNLFGWKSWETGLRRFRFSYKQVARKNFKTTEGAVKSIYHMYDDGENGAQVWCGSNKEEQARIVVNDTGKIIEKSPDLKDRFKLYNYHDKVTKVVYPAGDAFMQPMARDASTQDGFDPSYGIIDEYHEAKDDSILNVIESGMGNRLQPMIDVITTAGFNIGGACYQMRGDCIDILKGIKEDDSIFAWIFEMDEGDDWDNREAWIKANPRMHSDPNFIRFLDDRFTKAKNQGGSKEIDFRTKNLNQWQSSASAYISDDLWKSSNYYPITLADMEGRSVYVGLKFGSGKDYASACFISENERTEKLDCFWLTWVYSERSDDRDLKLWEDEGHLIVHEGNVIDLRQITHEILDKLRGLSVECIVYDSDKGHTEIVQGLQHEGYEELSPLSQRGALSPVVDEHESLILKGRLNVGNNPVSRWMNSNTYMKSSNEGQRYPSITESRGPISTTGSCINALAGWMQNRNESVQEWEMIIM